MEETERAQAWLSPYSVMWRSGELGVTNLLLRVGKGFPRELTFELGLQGALDTG